MASLDQINPDIEPSAIRLLSMREHSRRELVQKLTRRGFEPEQVETVIEQLAERGLQSDQRFAEGFIRARADKAYGPVRIRAELAERGLSRGLVESAFLREPMDWLALAERWYLRRYGDQSIDDHRERARRQQALVRRGFTTDVIRELVH